MSPVERLIRRSTLSLPGPEQFRNNSGTGLLRNMPGGTSQEQKPPLSLADILLSSRSFPAFSSERIALVYYPRMSLKWLSTCNISQTRIVPEKTGTRIQPAAKDDEQSTGSSVAVATAGS